MTPIAQEFGVPLIEVTAVFAVTLIMPWAVRRLPVGCPTVWGAGHR